MPLSTIIQLYRGVVPKSHTWKQVSILFTKMVAWRPNFVFGDQNLNLVASVTTSIIEVGDHKFWIIFRPLIRF
jgi:hypothetical protein